MEEEKKPEISESENSRDESQDKEQEKTEQKSGEIQSEEVLEMLYKRKKRTGKLVSRLSDKELETYQRKKSLFMYLSTLTFAVSLFLQVEGRTRLSDNKQLFALFSLYVFSLLAMIVLTVFISVMNRTRQRIGREIREMDTPRTGLDHRTFTSYELFNLLHIAIAAAEIAISFYKIGIWGIFNVIVSLASAVFSIISRQILYKANAGNLDFIEGTDEEKPKGNKKKNKKTLS